MLHLYLTLTLTLPSAYGEAKVQRLVLVTVSDSLANQIRYDMHYAKVSRALDVIFMLWKMLYLVLSCCRSASSSDMSNCRSNVAPYDAILSSAVFFSQ